jgi:hypothetical protein
MECFSNQRAKGQIRSITVLSVVLGGVHHDGVNVEDVVWNDHVSVSSDVLGADEAISFCECFVLTESALGVQLGYSVGHGVYNGLSEPL